MQQQALNIFPTPDIQLWQGDCLDLMPDIEDGSIDMVMADPPYGTTACAWDSIIPLEPMWKQLKRVIKPNGAIVLMGSQPFTTTLISSNMGMFKYEWIWDKIQGANFMNLKNRPFKTQEQIIVFAKSSSFTFNPIRVSRSDKSLKRNKAGTAVCKKVPSYKIEHYGAKTLTMQKLSADGMKHPIDIIQFPVATKGRYEIKHPTKKPVALMEYLIKTYTNEGETVLDFCMGSGTTFMACKNLNRNGIGIEKDPEYFEMAKERIHKENLD